MQSVLINSVISASINNKIQPITYPLRETFSAIEQSDVLIKLKKLPVLFNEERFVVIK